MFPEMSREMRDLLSKCLDLNPELRWTAEQCLTHPYFDSLGDEIDENLKELDWLDHLEIENLLSQILLAKNSEDG